MKNLLTGRRSFMKTAGTLAGLSFLPSVTWAGPAVTNELNIIGPKEGYSPQIGTLVSMMAWLRPQVINSVKKLTTEQLDFLLDEKANSIGALLNHLAATDAFYHEHTFTGVGPLGGAVPTN